MKTLVTVMLNGAACDHVFDMPADKFNAWWNLSIVENNHFKGKDVDGVTVFINPSQCPLIQIREWK